MREVDWEGCDVPPGESDTKTILVWEVSPHPQGTADYLLERSLNRMLDCVTDNLETMLENVDAADLFSPGGLILRFRLTPMLLSEYEEIATPHNHD